MPLAAASRAAASRRRGTSSRSRRRCAAGTSVGSFGRDAHAADARAVEAPEIDHAQRRSEEQLRVPPGHRRVVDADLALLQAADRDLARGRQRVASRSPPPRTRGGAPAAPSMRRPRCGRLGDRAWRHRPVTGILPRSVVRWPAPWRRLLATVGRYALRHEIASGGMAVVHLGPAARGRPGSRARWPSSGCTRTWRAIPSSSRCSSTRRGWPRASGTPTSCRRSTSSRPRASSSSSWSTCRATRSLACSAPRASATRACRLPVAASIMVERAARAARRARGVRRAGPAALRSCTATCRRTTCSSAPTASRTSSTSAWPRRPGARR